MNERDAAMTRRDVAFIRERDKYTLRDPKSEVDAARWLLACEQGGWQVRRVEYTLPARAPYQLGIPHPTDPTAFLTLHVRERDMQLVIKGGRMGEGWALWRPGITSRTAPDLSLDEIDPARLVETVAGQIGRWLADARAEQVEDAMRSAREWAGL